MIFGAIYFQNPLWKLNATDNMMVMAADVWYAGEFDLSSTLPPIYVVMVTINQRPLNTPKFARGKNLDIWYIMRFFYSMILDIMDFRHGQRTH